MSGGPLRQTVVIRNPQGFHFRPKGAVAQQALRFQAEVRLHWGGKTFNGKSMLDLLALAAEMGQEVTIEAEGPDAAEAVQALVEALRKFEDEEAPGQASSRLNES